MHDLNDIFVFIKKFFFAWKIIAVEILKLGAVKADSIPAIIQQGKHLLGQFDVAHNCHFETICCFSRRFALTRNDRLVFLIVDFTLFILNQGIFGRINDNRAAIPVHNDEVFAPNRCRSGFKTDNRRYLKAAGDNSGVGCFAAVIGNKPHNPFKVYLAGFSRGQILGNQNDTFFDGGNVHLFSPHQVMHNAVCNLNDICRPLS